MATFQYNQQYPGDASISPASSFGYESANSWARTQSSPISTANYRDINQSSSFDSCTGEKKSAKQIRAEAIQKHRNKKADLKVLAMSEGREVESVHETKDQIKQNNAKEARNSARAAHRQKKAQMKAMAMMTVQHGGAQSSSLTARQAAGLRYDAQQSQKVETKRLVHEMKQDPNDYVARKLVAARGMELQATTSRKTTGRWFGKTRDPNLQELKCQLEREREKDAEKKALKYLKVFETEEGFDIM